MSYVNKYNESSVNIRNTVVLGNYTYVLGNAYESGTQHLYISKLDANGNQIWQKKFSFSAADIGGWIWFKLHFSHIVEIGSTGNLMLLAKDKSNVLIITIDSNGDLLWRKKIYDRRDTSLAYDYLSVTSELYKLNDTRVILRINDTHSRSGGGVRRIDHKFYLIDTSSGAVVASRTLVSESPLLIIRDGVVVNGDLVLSGFYNGAAAIIVLDKLLSIVRAHGIQYAGELQGFNYLHIYNMSPMANNKVSVIGSFYHYDPAASGFKSSKDGYEIELQERKEDVFHNIEVNTSTEEGALRSLSSYRQFFIGEIDTVNYELNNIYLLSDNFSATYQTITKAGDDFVFGVGINLYNINQNAINTSWAKRIYVEEDNLVFGFNQIRSDKLLSYRRSNGFYAIAQTDFDLISCKTEDVDKTISKTNLVSEKINLSFELSNLNVINYSNPSIGNISTTNVIKTEYCSSGQDPVVDLVNSTIVANPTNIPADGSTTSTITVNLVDVNGNPISGSAYDVEIITNYGTITATQIGNGNYTALLSTTDVGPGFALLSFTVNTNLAANTAVVKFIPADGKVDYKRSTIVANPTVVPADGSTTSIVTVNLVDTNGNPISGSNYDVEILTNFGSVTPTSLSNGEYIAEVSSGTTGTAILSFEVNNTLASSTASVTFKRSTGKVDLKNSTIVAIPTSIPADGSTTSIIKVNLVDAGGNPISGSNYDVEILTNSGIITPTALNLGTYEAELSSTSIGGATLTFTVNDNLASANAIVTFFEAAGTLDLNNSTIVANPTSIPADGSTVSNITVHLVDTLGNTLSGNNYTVVVSSTIGVVSPNPAQEGFGNYIAQFSSNSVGNALLSFTVNGLNATDTATVQVTNDTAFILENNTSLSTVSLVEGSSISNTQIGAVVIRNNQANAITINANTPVTTVNGLNFFTTSTVTIAANGAQQNVTIYAIGTPLSAGTFSELIDIVNVENPSNFTIDFVVDELSNSNDCQFLSTFRGPNNSNIIYRDIEPVNSGGGFVSVGNLAGEGALITYFNDNGSVEWSKKYAYNGEALRFISVETLTNSSDIIVLGQYNTGEVRRSHLVVLRITIQGDIVWSKLLYSSNTRFGQDIRRLKETSPVNTFIITAWFNQYSLVDDIELYKIDANGTLLVANKAFVTGDDQILDIQTHDNGFVISGSTTPPPGQSIRHGMIMSFNNNVGIEWGKRMGGNSYNYISSFIFSEGNSFQQDENLLIGGTYDNTAIAYIGYFNKSQNTFNVKNIDFSAYGSVLAIASTIIRDAATGDIFFTNRFGNVPSFVTKFDAGLNEIWTKQFDSENIADVLQINIDAENLLLCGRVTTSNSGLIIKTDLGAHTCVTEILPPSVIVNQEFISADIVTNVETLPNTYTNITVSTTDIDLVRDDVCIENCNEEIILSDITSLQSPNFYLQAAGSDGADSTIGRHLRWIFRGTLGEKHLPKGNLATTAVNFNKPNDFVRIYKAPYRPIKATITFTEDTPEVVDSTNHLWIYRKGGKDLFLHFRNTQKYDQVLQTISPFTSPLPFLVAYGNELIELECKEHLFFSATLYFVSVDPGSTYSVETLSVNENTLISPKVVSARKVYNTSELGISQKLLFENGRAIRGIAHNCKIGRIDLEFYADTINYVNKTTGWEVLGEYALSDNELTVFAQLELNEGDVHGKWQRYNDNGFVNIANYHEKWGAIPEEGDRNIKQVVEKYIALSNNINNPTAIEEVPLGNDPNDPDDVVQISNLSMLNVASFDYHVARMLGLGTLDVQEDGDIITGEEPTYLYVAEYVTFGDLEDGLGAREVHHLSMSLPTSNQDKRLPIPVEVDQIVPGVFIGIDSDEPSAITNEDGYTHDGLARYVSLYADELPQDQINVPFFDTSNEFDLSTVTYPVYAGLEYKLGNQDWQKPELSYDSRYLNAVPVGEDSHFETRFINLDMSIHCC